MANSRVDSKGDIRWTPGRPLEVRPFSGCQHEETVWIAESHVTACLLCGRQWFSGGGANDAETTPPEEPSPEELSDALGSAFK